MKRKVNISLSRLLEVFEFSTGEMTYYLNIETGKVAMYSNLSGGFDEDGNQIQGKNAFAGRKYIEISGMHPYETFRDMEKFTAGLEDSFLKVELRKALDNRGAIRRFKEILSSHPREEARWQSYKKKCVIDRIYAWLDENDLELAAT